MFRRKILSLFLVFALLFVLMLNLIGCSRKIDAIDLMAGIEPRASVGAPGTLSETSVAAAADFALRLYRESYDGSNTLLSPLSVFVALAMTANGANGNTKTEMESVLGLSVPDLNEFCALYLNSLTGNDDVKLALANSIWLRDTENFAVKQAFLQTNADVYGAGAFRAPFNASTVKDVNQWVKDHTDGMIDKIVDGFTSDDMMLLINALVFDAKWASPYTLDTQVRSGDFHLENGTAERVKFLLGSEYRYLTDGDRAVGFVKPYVGGRYAFAALLPSEGTPVADYVASLTGETVISILKNAQYVSVETEMPKFETEYRIVLNDALSKMGMTDAFDPDAADFSGITESFQAFWIDEILHKTCIEVGEKGTRAAAVTSVRGKAASASPEETVPPVILDRPFVYLIFDTVTNLPLFIGTLNNPN